VPFISDPDERRRGLLRDLTALPPVVETPRAPRRNSAVPVLEVSRDTNPDEEARKRRTAEAAGVPAEAAESAPEDVEAAARRKAFLSDLDEATATTRFLTNPKNARVAHDSVRELSFIEGLANSLARGILGIQQGVRQAQAESEYEDVLDVGRSYLEILEDAGDHELDRGPLAHMEALYRWATSRVSERETQVGQFVRAQRSVGELVEQTAATPMSGRARKWKESVEEADTVLDKVVAVVSDPVGMGAFSAEVGAEFIPQLIAAGAVTAATRSPAAGAGAMGLASGATERYRSPAEFLSDAGVDSTDPEAVRELLRDERTFVEAQEYGATRGKIIGILDALSGGIAGKALANNPLGDLALQTIVQMAMGGGGEALAQKATRGEIDIDEVIFEAVGEFATTPVEVVAVGGRMLGKRASTVARAKDALDASRAESTVEQTDALAKAVQDSPVTERSPETAADHVSTVLADAGVEEVFVPSDALLEVEDADQLVSDLGVADQMEDAEAYGGDVRVGAREFAQHVLANPERYQALREHVRLDAEGLTLTEAGEVTEADAVEEGTEAIAAAAEEVSRDTSESAHTIQADDESVGLAEHEAGVGLMFRSAEEAGFTETQYASYVEAEMRTHTEAARRKERRRLKREERRLSDEYKAAREELRPEVEESVAQQPLYNALNGIGRERFDRARVVELLGGNEEALARLPKQSGRAIYTQKGQSGIGPDMHADVYGFSGGDTLLYSMLDRPSQQEAVEAELTRRVEERHPTLVSERGEVREAMEALHEGDQHSQVLAFELARLRQMRGQKRISRSLIRARARRVLSNRRVGEIRPPALETLQRREGRRAAKALRAGDLEAAARHKLNQAVAHEMTREAYKVRDELAKGRQRFRRYLKRGRERGKQGGLPIEFRERIQDLLGAFQFGRRKGSSRRLQRALDQPDVPRRPGEELEAWTARKKEEEGIVIPLGPTVTEADGSTHWENLTLRQWRELHNAVRDIETAGREANKLRNMLDRDGLDSITEEIASEVDANLKKILPRPSEDVAELTDVSAIRTMVDRSVDTMRRHGVNLSNILLNAESVLRRIDGWKNNGPAATFIKHGIDRAYSEGYLPGQVGYKPRSRVESERLNQIIDMIPLSERRLLWREQDIPGVHRRLSRAEQIAVVLNMGNAENIRALTEGPNGKPGQFTEAELRAIVNHVPKRYLDFAQAVWDFFESFRPELQETVRRRQNRNMVMVEALPLETRHGTYRGGFFPLQYDSERGVTAGITGSIDVEDARDMMLRGGFSVAHTRDGHTQTRVGSGGRPVKLDPFTINRHLDQLVYDLEMGDAVYDSYRVIHNPRVRQAFTDAGLPQLWDALDLWHGDVVTGELHRGGLIESSFRYVRVGTTLSKLGFNFAVAMLQPLGLLQSVVMVGKRNMAIGTMQFLRNPMAVARWVNEQSPFMEARTQEFNKEIHLAHQNLRAGMLERIGGRDFAGHVADSMMFFITKTQRFTDLSTWMGAYRQGMREFKGNHEQARMHAERMVERTQGSGVFHQRTGFERGTVSRNIRNTEFVRGHSLFLSYFAAKLNVAYERTKKVDFKDPWSVVNYPVDLALLYFVEGFVIALVDQAFGDEDDEDFADSMVSGTMEEAAKSFFAGFPVVREGVSRAQRFPTGPSAVRFVGDVGEMVREVSQGDLDRAAARDIANVVGVLTKLPTGQVVNKTGDAVYEDYLWDDTEWWEYLTGPERR